MALNSAGCKAAVVAFLSFAAAPALAGDDIDARLFKFQIHLFYQARAFFQGQDDNPKYFDGKLNPFLFFLPFFAFIHLNKDPALLRSEKKIFIFSPVFFQAY